MARDVRVSPEAKEQLRAIGQKYVIAESFQIAYTDLSVPPRGAGGLDGHVADRVPALWWRRAIPLRDIDDYLKFTLDDEHEDSCQACDYVLLYREMTADERISFGVAGIRPIMVVGVYPNEELAGHLLQVLLD